MDWNIHFVFPQHILVGVLNLLCDRTDFVSSHWLFFFFSKKKKISNSKSQSENNQRQARESVNQALRESSENYEVMMMQELQSMVNEIPELLHLNMLISQKEREQQRALRKNEEKTKIVSKCSCSEGGKSSVEHDTAKKKKRK